MRPYKFKVGAVVDFRAHYAQSGGAFVVVRHMPPDSEGNQYRIESRRDGGVRVAHEAELSRAGSGAGG